MKKVTLVVKPFKADAVVRALLDAGAESLTVMEARGYGRQKGRLELYHEERDRVTFLPKVRIECALRDEALQEAIRDASEAARTGRIGDGKIFLEELT